jgi:phage terminase large subunit-like protein
LASTKSRKRPQSETRGDRACRWVQDHCRIPEGKDVGKPVRLREWQRDIIRGIYDQPTRRAIISFGRKNAKTTLSAFLLLLHLCGPEARANSQLFSAAQSRDQASLLFGLAAKVVRMSPTLSQFVVVRDTAKQLFCSELGTLYRALSAEASTAYGLSPVFIVHDELGQVKGPRSELYEALETATAAQEDPLSIVISTQAPTGTDLLSVLIDDAKNGGDPKVRLFIYAADPDADPFAEETIRQANPAFGDFQNASEVLAMAEDARRMPSRESEYRNLILNQRVERNSPFISRSIWQSCGGEVIESFKDLPVYGGLDLSETTDLTALVLIAAVDGVWHVKPTFWLPEEGLRERARKDRVPYDVWAGQGLIETTPGKSIEYEFVAEYLRGIFDDLDIRQVAFDRWNFRHLKPWLLKAGFEEAEIEAKFVEFGQGFQSMSPALRDLEGSILNGKLAHGNNPVLTMCAANAVVQKDPAGNRKLTKAKSRGRIDGMISLAMATSVAITHEGTVVVESIYDMLAREQAA